MIRTRFALALVVIAPFLIAAQLAAEPSSAGEANGPASQPAAAATLPPDPLTPTGSFTFLVKPEGAEGDDRLPYAWWSGLTTPVPLIDSNHPASPTDIDHAELSPNGRLLAVTRTRTPDLSPSDIDFEWPQVSVFRVGNSQPLWTVAATPGVFRSRSDSPSWSPDGSRLLFRRAGDSRADHWIADADGRNMRRVAQARGVAIWAPEGDHILTYHRFVPNPASATEGFGFTRIDLDSGAEATVVEPSQSVRQASVFASALPGEIVAWSNTPTSGTTVEMRRLSYGGNMDGVSAELTGTAGYANLAVASDGVVAYTTRSGQATVLNGARLANLNNPGVSEPVPFPLGLDVISAISWSSGRPDFRVDGTGGGGTGGPPPLPPVPGTTYTVTTIDAAADVGCLPAPGDCTLAEAIEATNANPGPDTILIDTEEAGGSRHFAGPLPTITGAVTLNDDGPDECGAVPFTIDGEGAPPGTPGLVIDQQGVDPGGPTTITGLTVRGFPGDGIVVRNSVQVSLECSQSRRNRVGISVQDSSDITVGTNLNTLTWIFGNSGDGLDVRQSQRVRAFAHLGHPYDFGAGNGGSGARITDSTDVKIQAGAIGGNTASGVAIEGSSSRVQSLQSTSSPTTAPRQSTWEPTDPQPTTPKMTTPGPTGW